MNDKYIQSVTLDTPVLQHGDAVLELFAHPLVHCDSGTSAGRRPEQKHSAACPHVAGLPGLYNQVTPCHVNSSNRFGDFIRAYNFETRSAMQGWGIRLRHQLESHKVCNHCDAEHHVISVPCNPCSPAQATTPSLW